MRADDDGAHVEQTTRASSSRASSASMTPTTPTFPTAPTVTASSSSRVNEPHDHVDAFSSDDYDYGLPPAPLLWQLPAVWVAPNGQLAPPPRLWAPSLPEHLSLLVDRQFSAYEHR